MKCKAAEDEDAERYNGISYLVSNTMAKVSESYYVCRWEKNKVMLTKTAPGCGSSESPHYKMLSVYNDMTSVPVGNTVNRNLMVSKVDFFNITYHNYSHVTVLN